MLPFPQTAVSAVRRSFPAARLDCGVTLEGGSSEAGDRIDRALGSFAIRPVVDHDTRAGLGKPDGDRPPDAARRPCHQCGPKISGRVTRGTGTQNLPTSALAGRWAPPERSGDFVWTGELVSWMPADVLKADEGATFELAGILERPLMELHMGVVVEQDVYRLVRRALELLSREHGTMTPREVVEVGADDETDVLEAHPIDALMKRRDQLDELERSRLGEQQGVSE